MAFSNIIYQSNTSYFIPDKEILPLLFITKTAKWLNGHQSTVSRYVKAVN